jgi:parvulin-like peptidyl-prolyl isomerase
MKKVQFILITFVILLCLNCGGKDASNPEGYGDKTGTTGESFGNSIENKIILTINDRQSTNEELINFIKSRYTDTSIIEKNPKLASRVFDTFIEHKMLLYMVEKENTLLDQGEIVKYLKDKHLPLNKANDPSVIDNIKAQKYLYFKLYKDIDVTDVEIRQYYERNLDNFKKAQEVLLHQILVKDKEKAYEIRETLLNTPQRFAEIAKKQSVSMEAKNGGLMGYFEKGTLPKDMEDVVFALKLDTISPVVESPYGYHIFKVTKVKTERTLFLETVKNEIKNKLLSDKLRWAYEDFLAQLKKQLNMNVKYRSLFFTYQPAKG